jgi:hypothetical protein
MMVKTGGEVIQAFPITPATYTGTPTSFNPAGYSVIHAAADCDITFDFGTSGTVVITATAGQDLAIHSDCMSITATGEVWIS